MLELREEMPKLADKLVRDPDHLHHAHKGGWSSPDHQQKAREAPVLPIKPGKTYEVTSLPLDDWGHFSVRVTEPDAEKMTVTLHRLKDDCDPCLFVRRAAKPTQEVYDKCTYQTWSTNERDHTVVLEGLDVDVYYIGVWNTPIFGRNDAAFSIKVTVEKAKGERCWVDEAEAMSLELRVTHQQLGFSVLPPKTPLARYVKINKVADAPKIEGLRPMEADDVVPVQKLLNSYLTRYKLNIQFSVDEIAHFLLPREWVIESFVVEDKESKEITDFFSFYSLPSTILRHDTHKILNVAYSYYNVPNTITLTELMADALVIAKQKGYDVFNALDVHQNQEFFKELKFAIGDGNLNYYLYNWRIEKISPEDVGIVLV